MEEITEAEFRRRLEHIINEKYRHCPAQILYIPRVLDVLEGYFLERILIEWEKDQK